MHVVKPGGTREQKAVADWLDGASLIRSRLAAATEHVPTLGSCFDTWSIAVARFGECELHARALDRSHALDVFEERRPWLTELVSERNEAGIDQLERLRKQQLPEFARELDGVNIEPGRAAEVLDELEREVRLQFADWEMKGTDAKKLMDQFEAVAGIVRSSGLPALGEHLDKAFEELIAGRREPNRGTQENMPWWKWMLLAGAFGWMIAAAIVWAVWTGGRFVVTIAFGIIEITHWIAFVLFC